MTKCKFWGRRLFGPIRAHRFMRNAWPPVGKHHRSLEDWAHLVTNELSYLTVQNFPWVRNKDFVESMEAYVRFGAHSVKSALGSSVRVQKFLKLGFIFICQLRWKLKFFAWPIEFKIAKKFVAK